MDTKKTNRNIRVDNCVDLLEQVVHLLEQEENFEALIWDIKKEQTALTYLNTDKIDALGIESILKNLFKHCGYGDSKNVFTLMNKRMRNILIHDQIKDKEKLDYRVLGLIIAIFCRGIIDSRTALNEEEEIVLLATYKKPYKRNGNYRDIEVEDILGKSNAFNQRINTYYSLLLRRIESELGMSKNKLNNYTTTRLLQVVQIYQNKTPEKVRYFVYEIITLLLKTMQERERDLLFSGLYEKETFDMYKGVGLKIIKKLNKD